MTEYLKNNPVALRHCLLYEYLQRNPYKRAFTNIRDTIGSDVFSEEQLRSYFNQFRKRKMDGDDRRITDMRDVLRNDKYALRACILYESLKYKMAERGYSTQRLWPRSFLQLHEIRHNPSFALHSNFCKKLGEDAMHYPEFDFWFRRFVNEEFDLKFERDKNRKILELSDMPIDIMRDIVEYLDIADRLSLERTSQSLRLFSREQQLFQGILTLYKDDFSTRIMFGGSTCIGYKNEGNDCVTMFRRSKKVIRGVTYSEQVLQDFKKILENPKLHVKKLTFWCSCEKSKSLGRTIGDALKFTHLLRVEHINVRAQSMKELLNILPSLTPGYLTTITFDIDSDDAAIEEVVQMEQWKQAKYFKEGFQRFVCPLRYLYHFKQFTISYRNLSEEDAREMKEILLKSPNFEECTLYLRGSVDPIAIMQVFGGPIDGSNEICHYPIVNSTDYFEVIVRNDFFKISKQKK